MIEIVQFFPTQLCHIYLFILNKKCQKDYLHRTCKSFSVLIARDNLTGFQNLKISCSDKSLKSAFGRRQRPHSLQERTVWRTRAGKGQFPSQQRFYFCSANTGEVPSSPNSAELFLRPQEAAAVVLQLPSSWSGEAVVLLSGFTQGSSDIMNMTHCNVIHLACAGFIYMVLVVLLGVSDSRSLSS